MTMTVHKEEEDNTKQQNEEEEEDTKQPDEEEEEWNGTYRGKMIRKGGWKTSPFIFGNEVCEKLGAIGLQVNLVTYLVQQLHMKTAEAANTLTNFGGTSALTPLVGAFIADAYVGRYWVVVFGTILYTIGTILLTMQAMIPKFRPSPCISDHQKCEQASKGDIAILYLAFFFLATGSGGIRPCVAAFGADQFNQHCPKQRRQLRHFFNWYYFTLAMSVLTTVTIFVYIQDNVGWGLGFGIPAICLALSILTFLLGTPIYRMVKPTGSPISRLLQVIVAALRKRNLKLPADPTQLNHGSQISNKLLPHTQQFRFLDKAAIITGSNTEEAERGLRADSRWTTCTVHQVEEMKLLLRMMPIWLTGMLVFTAWSQQGTFWVQQGRTMERHLWGTRFQIPPGSMTCFATLTLLVWLPVYDKVLIPALRKITGQERGITFLQRIGTGLFLSILVMATAGFIEMKRRNIAREAGLLDLPHRTVPISIFWLLPQYMLIGLMESFMWIGHLEFFYDQSPESMRSMSTAIFWTVIAAGSYISSFLVSIIRRYSSASSTGDWLADNLNRAKLHYFYWLLSAMLTINFLIFLVCAKWYRYKIWTDPNSFHKPVNSENGHL